MTNLECVATEFMRRVCMALDVPEQQVVSRSCGVGYGGGPAGTVAPTQRELWNAVAACRLRLRKFKKNKLACMHHKPTAKLCLPSL